MSHKEDEDNDEFGSHSFDIQNRRMGSTLTGNLYNLLRDYIREECRKFPDKELLIIEMSKTMHVGAKKNYNRVYKKFRNWANRMKIGDNGELIHRGTNKIIIPVDQFESV